MEYSVECQGKWILKILDLCKFNVGAGLRARPLS
jgi:hypothetical protein